MRVNCIKHIYVSITINLWLMKVSKKIIKVFAGISKEKKMCEI